jgi:hypothetical protein
VGRPVCSAISAEDATMKAITSQNGARRYWRRSLTNGTNQAKAMPMAGHVAAIWASPTSSRRPDHTATQ